MARQAHADLRDEFGVPLGLIILDTIPAAAGYSRSGDEQDSAAAQAVHNVLRMLAQETGTFVFGGRPLWQEPGSWHPRVLEQGSRVRFGAGFAGRQAA
jgi:hypothetical protein